MLKKAVFFLSGIQLLQAGFFTTPGGAQALSPSPASQVVKRSWNPEELETLKNKIGQMIFIYLPDYRPTPRERWLLSRGYVGGVVLFAWNIRDRDQAGKLIRELQQASKIPLFIALDQEGGAVNRLTKSKGFSSVPSGESLGRSGDSQEAYRAGWTAGGDLKEIGANMDFAPVLDLDHGQNDAVITGAHRSLGKDPRKVGELAEKFMEGLRARGILATAKHFPSQSWAALDTHEGAAMSDVALSTLESEDLVPYRALIVKGLDAIMLSHVTYRRVDPDFPASLSPAVVQRLLREELGFQGLVVSDAFNMKAVSENFSPAARTIQSVKAGVDLLLVDDGFQTQVMDALVEEITEGHLPEEWVDKAYRRILSVKAKYHILPAGRQASSGDK